MLTILPEFENQYHKYVELGKDFLYNKNVIVIGLTRNIEKVLVNNIQVIEKLRSFFGDLSYFIYENDSRDQTPNILSSLKYEIKNFNFVSEQLNFIAYEHNQSQDLKAKERTMNLARHRNRCLSYVKKNYSNTDFVIALDLDFKHISIDGILNSFGWFSCDYADALVGNSFELKDNIVTNKQTLWNYDCWAYRGSWWEDLQKYVDVYDFDPMMWFGFWQPPIGSQPIPVNSAFGGIGIYKTEHYISSQYDGYDCEHVCFHKNLKNLYPNYRLCINPSQIMVF